MSYWVYDWDQKGFDSSSSIEKGVRDLLAGIITSSSIMMEVKDSKNYWIFYSRLNFEYKRILLDGI